jgi:uroporphyrinogen-III synthase
MNLVLITRPQPDADDYAKRVEAAGFKTLVEPVLRVEPLPFPVPDTGKYDGLVFTSTNGVRLSPSGFDPDLSVYCVGKKTATEAKTRGFTNVISADGDAAALSALLREKAHNKRLLHIHGRHVAGGGLKGPGHIEDLIVYQTTRVLNLSPACIRALKEKKIQAVTFFSARTARTFINLIQKHELFETLGAIKLLSISDSVLQSVRAYRWAGTYTSETPDAGGMLNLIRKVCAK